MIDFDSLDQKDAEQLLAFSLTTSERINDELLKIHEHGTEKAFLAARRLAAELLGKINWEVLRPTKEKFPEIVPPGFFPE